jgi:hypothetical protein
MFSISKNKKSNHSTRRERKQEGANPLSAKNHFFFLLDSQRAKNELYSGSQIFCAVLKKNFIIAAVLRIIF